MMDSAIALESILDSAWLNTRNSTTNLYALIDTTKQPELIEKLKLEKPEHISLFDIDDDYELKHITPYIIKLEPHSDFKSWLLESWMGKSSGFFFYSNVDSIEVLYQHFVTFTEVFDETNKTTSFFNYYNPVTIRVWLHLMPNESCLEFFSPIQSIVMEGISDTDVEVLELDDMGNLLTSEVSLNEDNDLPGDQKKSMGHFISYENSMSREAKYNTQKNLPWVLSTEEKEGLRKISWFNFMYEITKKMWIYPSINQRHTYKKLWENVQVWTQKLYDIGIFRKDDLAHFLVLLAKYEEQWIENGNKVNLILSDTTLLNRQKYLYIRDIVVLKAKKNNE